MAKGLDRVRVLWINAENERRRKGPKDTPFTSVFDFVHFTALEPMTIQDVSERFGCTQKRAEIWRDTAIKAGVKLTETQTPKGVAYRSVSLRQGKEALEVAKQKLVLEKAERNRINQRRYREQRRALV